MQLTLNNVVYARVVKRSELRSRLKVDIDRLKYLLDFVPLGMPCAFEFRNESWLCDDVFDVLKAADISSVGLIMEPPAEPVERRP